MHGFPNVRRRNAASTMTASAAGLLVVLLIAAVPAAAQKTENILLITFDGLRTQEVFGGVDPTMLTSEAHTNNTPEIRKRFWAPTPEQRRVKLMPFFWGAIARQGQVFGAPEKNSTVTVTNGRYFSYPGYNEILTGKADDRVNSNAKRLNQNVTVLEWLNKRPAFQGRVAAFCSWDVFPFIINEPRSGVPVNAGWEPLPQDGETSAWMNRMQKEIPHYWGGVRFDIFTFQGAMDYLNKHKPRVLYVGFGETDDWAHDGRYDLYLDAAHRTDEYIRLLWEAMQAIPEYAGKTTLIMATDHGRGNTPKDWTGHGADTPGSERIWMAVMGPDTPAQGMASGEYTQSQVAATVAALLGLDYLKTHPGAGAPLAPAVPTTQTSD